MGSKPYMCIRLVSGGWKQLEFGAFEAASNYDGSTDRKYHYESTIKLPKMLKDMLFDLCKYVDWDVQKTKQIEVEGCIQSGRCLKIIPLFVLLLLLIIGASSFGHWVSYHDPPKRIRMPLNSIEEFRDWV